MIYTPITNQKRINKYQKRINKYLLRYTHRNTPITQTNTTIFFLFRNYNPYLFLNLSANIFNLPEILKFLII